MTTMTDPGVDIGHVRLKVADLDRAVDFCSGALGFEVTTRMPGAAFLSAGGYHHHIGFNTWESTGGSPPPSGTNGLFRFAIRYPTVPRSPPRSDASWRPASGCPGRRITG